MADQVQTFTNSGNATEVPIPFEMLTAIQRAYIDWKALGGIIINEDGEAVRLTLDRLGAMLDGQNPIAKQVLSSSCKNVPNFWDLVNERRKVFNSTSRLAYIHEKWFVASATMKNWPMTEAWLINHDETYKAPKLKVEHDVGTGFADLINAMRMKQAKERKVIDATPSSPADNQANA